MKSLVGDEVNLTGTDVCLYASAKDKDVPLVGLLPSTGNVFLATFGAGDSAKHAVAMGQMLSRMMGGQKPGFSEPALDVFDPSTRLK
jgi:glycine/D-amino acid oxidase-like deaminating enzyme